jgi:hypothetical protein
VTEAVNNQKQSPDLLAILIEHKLISTQQAKLVEGDVKATGLHTADIILTRRWVKLETLLKVAPWLEQDMDRFAKSTDNLEIYKANLIKYRQFTNKILDEELK